MSEPTQKEPRQTRVPIGAFINVDQREQVVALARKEDRSVSAVRRALAAELDRHEARAS